jgi:glycosyltransferase involved in cell wall biosynthesis
MKVIIIHLTLPAYRKDFFESLNQQLKERDIDLTVIHGSSYFNKTIKSDTNPKYSTVPLVTRDYNFIGYRIVWWKGIFKKIRNIDPDMIIVHFCPGNISLWLVQLYCYLFRINVGIWANGSVRKEMTGIKKKLRKLFLNFFLFRAKFHICYGTKYKKELLELGIKEEKIFVAQNTINIEKILSLSANKKYDINKEWFNILFVGALIRAKNLDLTIKAIARLIREGYKVKFNIIGQGLIIDELRSLVKSEEMEENIFVLGYISDEEIPTFFLNADVFLLTGMGGLAINEAMAYGLPVISSVADGTIIDLLYDGKNGYYLDEEINIENIYSTCKKALEDSRSKLAEMGIQSRQIVHEKASLNNMVSGFESAIIYGSR